MPLPLTPGSLRGPGAYVPPTGGGTGTGVGDGGFQEPPTVITSSATGDVTIKGKVKAGSFGKFVLPLANVTAGRQYTFQYTPQFQRLAQQGKLAMVGFGFKHNNDFNLVGLRGDGSTGLHKYQVNGTSPNGWNKDTGHTTNDGGASANGTQAGPNYIRIAISSDGTTYTFSSSPDGVTYTAEFSTQTPTPFSNVSTADTFGLALWFNNADAGPFSITMSQFVDAAAQTWATFDGTTTDVTLSNGNLTATASNANSNAGTRSTFLRNSGKYYFEVTAGSLRGNADSIGIVTSAGSFTDMESGPSNCAVTRYFLNPNAGEIYSNNADSGKKIGLFSSQTVGVAVDLDNDKIWFRLAPSGDWNGDNTANPATNTGGVSISSYSATTVAPAVCFGGTGTNTGNTFTANFGASSFVGTVPSGFISGWS